MIIRETFYVLTTAVVIFAILEFIHQGIVIAYLNFNSILLLWLINGIIILLMRKQKVDNRK